MTGLRSLKNFELNVTRKVVDNYYVFEMNRYPIEGSVFYLWIFNLQLNGETVESDWEIKAKNLAEFKAKVRKLIEKNRYQILK